MWDDRMLELAAFVAQWSKDPSTKVGAVVARGNRVVSVGYNGFPRGTDDHPEIYADRTKKLARVVHGDANALIFAGDRAEGCTLYVWPMMPCAQCAALAIQCGIRRVVAGPNDNLRWRDSVMESMQLFYEAGVEATQR